MHYGLLLIEADQILSGRTHLFGGYPVPLNLEAGASDLHWTALEKTPPEEDIKLIWEPGRFGWAITLARAYAFSELDRYAAYFWEKTLHFLDTHPPNRGRQWQSAQEVAIRLMSLAFCDRVLASAPSSTPANRSRLCQAVADHAQRIPPTMIYARAQNNNHLLSEAAGLFTAGCYLPDHPQAETWRNSGWHWLNWGFQHQINDSGTYIQHSVNYHRLMLQIALYADYIRREVGGLDWPSATLSRLSEATRWLWALTDPKTGQVPNLGANDGAYIFPFTQQPFSDFRPVVDATAKAFLHEDVYEKSTLAEMPEWLGLSAPPSTQQPIPQAPDMLRINHPTGRAFIRAARFTDRPSHADQLHVDLWWRGVNIVRDPGTYLYNAPPPWENALSGTQVHNTLTLDGQDQMQRAGRFLWLDWAQAEVLAHEVDDEGRLKWITAEHNGYRRMGVIHQRTLSTTENGWTITDKILPYNTPKNCIHEARLSWLLPDWEWQFDDKGKLCLTGPEFAFSLEVKGAEQVSLFRSSKCLYGNFHAEPIWGWFSPNYSLKEPSLLFVFMTNINFDIIMESRFEFIKLKSQTLGGKVGLTRAN